MQSKDILASLKVTEGEYLAETVDVRVIRDHESLEVEGRKVELKAGSELRMPRWLARSLAKKGIVQIVEHERVDYNEVSKYAFLEGQGSPAPLSLVRLPKSFYIKYREYMEGMKEELKSTGDHRVLGEMERARAAMSELVNMRLRKILLAVQIGVKLEDIRDRLAYEEEALYISLQDTIKEWKRRCALLEEDKE